MKENLRIPNLYYLGPEGSNSEVAATTLINSLPEVSFNKIPCASFSEIFANASAGFGLIPMENSLGGSVFENYDLLSSGIFKVIAEIKIPIQHHVWVNKEQFKGQLQSVYSHPQALLQCSRFIAKYQLEGRFCRSTAAAAKAIASGNIDGAPLDLETSGALANHLAGEGNNLQLAFDNVQDYQNNQTRFFLIGQTLLLKEKDKVKSCFIMRLPHERGALHKVLGVFLQAEANLEKIESRTIKDEPFHYQFFIEIGDFAWTPEQIVTALEPLCEKVTCLGTYPLLHAV